MWTQSTGLSGSAFGGHRLASSLGRRAFLAAMGAAAAAIAQPEGAASVALGGPLTAAAASGGRRFGAAARLAALNVEPDLLAAYLWNCDEITPETALSWAAMEPARGQLVFAPLDDLAAFALAHGKRVRGHVLLWSRALPEWAAARMVEAHDWGAVRNWFASVIPRYGASIDEWIVVNEPIDTGHRLDGLREGPLLAAFGPDYIARALREARLFAPKARLMINDYGLEYGLPVERDRRYLLLKLVERLRSAGAPLDGVGLQAHLDLAKGPLAIDEIAAFLRDLASLEVFVAVTELDVKESDYAAPVAARDAAVADEARRYLDVALAQPGGRRRDHLGTERSALLAGSDPGGPGPLSGRVATRGGAGAESRPARMIRTCAQSRSMRRSPAP